MRGIESAVVKKLEPFTFEALCALTLSPRRLGVLSCGSVCRRSCATVIARLASTHTALVSQSLVGLCFAFLSIYLPRRDTVPNSGPARGPRPTPCAAPQCGNGAPALRVAQSTNFPNDYG